MTLSAREFSVWGSHLAKGPRRHGLPFSPIQTTMQLFLGFFEHPAILRMNRKEMLSGDVLFFFEISGRIAAQGCHGQCQSKADAFLDRLCTDWDRKPSSVRKALSFKECLDLHVSAGMFVSMLNQLKNISPAKDRTLPTAINDCFKTRWFINISLYFEKHASC